MNKNCIWTVLFLSCLVLFSSCGGGTSEGNSEQETDKINAADYAFDADSAFAFVEAQTAFGPRVPGSKAHQNCLAYLSGALNRFVDTVIVQQFDVRVYDGRVFAGKNIIGSFNPQAERRVVLASHWDSRPFADQEVDEAKKHTPIDGANDGASGVGVLLEIARQLRLSNTELGVDIIFFDLEDYGEPAWDMQDHENAWALGSQWWAENPHVSGYKARYGILLDMVGGQNAIFAKEEISMYYAQSVVDDVWMFANQLGYGSTFVNQPGSAITDDHLYVNQHARIPMIDIIEYNKSGNHSFNPTWHTLDDNINHIDKNTLERVGKVVLCSIKNR